MHPVPTRKPKLKKSALSGAKRSAKRNVGKGNDRSARSSRLAVDPASYDIPEDYEITDSELLMAFSTPVLKCSLPFDMEPIAESILKRSVNDKGVQLSNQGGWQSSGAGQKYESADDVSPQFLEWDELPEMQAIINFVGGYLVDESKGKHFTKRWHVGAWANVNRPGTDKNEWHTHPGVFWSCVFWPQVPHDMRGGQLMLHDPRGHLPIQAHPFMSIDIQGCQSAGAVEAFVPEVGKLVCFPGWLPHDVRPFSGSCERISVALNFSPIMEDSNYPRPKKSAIN